MDFPGGSVIKDLQYRRCWKHRFYPWVGKIPWKRRWQPTPVLLTGKAHKQRTVNLQAPVHRITKSQAHLAAEHTGQIESSLKIHSSIFSMNPCTQAHGLWKGVTYDTTVSFTWASDPISPSSFISKAGMLIITPTSQDYCKNEME